MIIGRFAPSPTGKIHLGNLRIALINYLWIKKQGGLFFLRIDDTDMLRSKKEYEKGIKESLNWCGIQWDQQFHQKDNIDRYNQVFEDLLQKGIIYPCYETEEELELQRKQLLKLKKPPIYNRSALKLTENNKNILREKGIAPHFRFKLKRKPVSWDDAVHGNVKINTINLSDPIVKRTNGEYTYMLPSVIDDFDKKITHIIRGEDHLTNTAIQIEMFEHISIISSSNKDIATNKIPIFAHISLLKFQNQKISKRVGGLEIENFLNNNIFPLAVTSYLAKLGTSSQDSTVFNNINDMINNFDISRFTTSSTLISLDAISLLNRKILQASSFEDVKNKIQNKKINNIFWDTVKNNINTITDVELLYEKYYSTSYKNENIDKKFLQTTLDILPENITTDSVKVYINTLISKYSRNYKPKQIYLWIRLILTSELTGPELYKLFQIINLETIKRKIQYMLSNT